MFRYYNCQLCYQYLNIAIYTFDSLSMKKEVLVRKIHPGHPWIFSNEIFRVFGEPAPGDVVKVTRKAGRKRELIGFGFYNPHSLIAVRLFSKEEDFTKVFLKKKIERALRLRQRILEDNSFRLIHGESDGLPGLIIDKYENGFVLEINCLGMEIRKNLIIDTLAELFNINFIYEKSDSHYRKFEGLEPVVRIVRGELQERVVIIQNGIHFSVDIIQGQKTGFYFDQRTNRQKVKELAAGKRVLDLFCYTGGFALYAGQGKAKSVLGVDSSERAIELAQENSRLNNLERQCSFVVGDVFEFLREKAQSEEKFDLIILDPPAFAKTKREVKDARRGYKDINLFAMKVLAPDGLLVTSTCSHYVNADDFIDILNQARIDAGREFRIIGRGFQSGDHPVVIGMPESEYLKCFYLQSF